MSFGVAGDGRPADADRVLELVMGHLAHDPSP